MEQKSETFRYTYSPQQQEEVQNIRQKYVPRQEGKMEQLRRLDHSAVRPGTIAALVLGTVSCLVFGFGMCCTMLWPAYFAPGVVIGLVGIAGVAAAYPVYAVITKKQRRKLAGQILALTDELLQNP